MPSPLILPLGYLQMLLAQGITCNFITQKQSLVYVPMYVVHGVFCVQFLAPLWNVP